MQYAQDVWSMYMEILSGHKKVLSLYESIWHTLYHLDISKCRKLIGCLETGSNLERQFATYS